MAGDVLQDIFQGPDIIHAGKVLLVCENYEIDNVTEIYTNVPHLVRHYEPFQYHWGYLGARPSELSLNILQFVFNENLDWTSGRRVSCTDGSVNEEAWYLHRLFVHKFLSNLPSRQNSEILYYRIEEWLLEQMPGL